MKLASIIRWTLRFATLLTASGTLAYEAETWVPTPVYITCGLTCLVIYLHAIFNLIKETSDGIMTEDYIQWEDMETFKRGFPAPIRTEKEIIDDAATYTLVCTAAYVLIAGIAIGVLAAKFRWF